MFKIMTIVGTRPELIKLSCVISKMDQHFDHILVHTGQNYDYELNEIFFRDLEIREPDLFLNCACKTAMETVGKILVETDLALARYQPDAVLIYGDTNSCLSVIAAKRRQVPVFHMEAGNRCFNQNVPEEINRKIVDHLSDINMPLTEHARRYLIKEGLAPQSLIKTGSTMREVLNKFKERIEKSTVLSQLNLTTDNYFVVSAHREETVDNEDKLGELLEFLKRLEQVYSFPIIFSCHPRTRKKLEAFDKRTCSSVQLMKPLGFFDYIQLQRQAHCVISDSGTLMEESAIMGFPAVHPRAFHERPEGEDHGVFVYSDVKTPHLMDAIKMATSLAQSRGRTSYPVADYLVENSSEIVVKAIFGQLSRIQAKRG